MIDTLTRDERSVLLYAETCVVDASGLMEGVRMNEADIAALKKFQSEGLLSFGRIPARLLNSLRQRQATHWVTFHDGAWTLAHQLRRKRAERIGPDRAKVNEALAESADGVKGEGDV